MKKKLFPWLIAVAALLAVLFVPIPTGAARDGGTRSYCALTYRIVAWNRLTDDGVYQKTRVYFLADAHRSLDELWQREAAYVEHRFLATVLEVHTGSVIVAPLENEIEWSQKQRLSFSVAGLEDIGANVGSVVEVSYTGSIQQAYPFATIDATGWRISMDRRHLSYEEIWLDKSTAEKYDHDIFSDIVITEIYSNCFFARPVIPTPYEIKLNGTLSDDWCVGDQIITTYENTYYDRQNNRVEADLLTVAASDFQMDPNMCYKPVIYLYPEAETQVSVKLTPGGGFTCTYPAYKDGWNVTAAPDGTLTDASGQTYNYLYWEGLSYTQYDFSQGFCVKGTDTAAFLEQALEALGLNRREANEFIIYWLPLMQENPYNIISFQTERYTEAAKLEISPAPDTVFRVFMAYKASDTPVTLPAQTLTAPERTGFTVVEWGGTQVK